MLISPSLLSCDFGDLKNEVQTVSAADMLHVDVMDGHFVPNISIGIPVVEALRRTTDMTLDVHLMISDPEKYAERFAKAGSDIITVHYEAIDDIPAFAAQMKALGVKPSVSIKPATPANVIFPYLDMLDMVLVMTVEPGFGGQAMIESCLPKITALKTEIARRGLKTLVEADGGINEKTLDAAVAAGTDVFVMGSAVFAKQDRNEFMRRLKNKYKEA